MRYDIISLGFPAILDGGVYTGLMKHISRLLNHQRYDTAGLDYGFKEDALASNSLLWRQYQDKGVNEAPETMTVKGIKDIFMAKQTRSF